MSERPRIGRELRTGAPAWMADYPDDTPVELDLGAVRELVERLEKLEQIDEVVKRLDILSDVVSEHGRYAETGKLGHPPLKALRTNGVTRYKAGEFEIELAPPGVPSEARQPRCAACHEAEPFHQRSCPVAPLAPLAPPGEPDAPDAPDAPPPDEKPPVEIDVAATEELLRRQDERRRGPAQ